MTQRFLEKVSRVVPGSDGYEHFFGGPARHQGAVPTGCPVPLHLLVELDMDDPQVGLRLPGIRRLPLYYGIRYGGFDLSYRVISNDAIAAVQHGGADAFGADYPMPEYPVAFPRQRVKLEPISYREHKTLAFLGKFGGLLPEDVVSEEDRRYASERAYPFTQVGGFQLLMQGVPPDPCPNAECEYHAYPASMDVFAVVWNETVPGIQLWGEYGKFTEIIFQLCPKCSTFLVTNQCD